MSGAQEPRRSIAGLVVAWLGFAFGSVVSVAGNVISANIRPHGVAMDWRPDIGSQLFAAVWPMALLLSVEIITRWSGQRWSGQAKLWEKLTHRRTLALFGVAVVAIGAAVISYQHIRDVLLGWHYPELSASVGPLVIDGLMIVSGFAMMAHSKAERGREKTTAEVEAPAAPVVELPRPVEGEPVRATVALRRTAPRPKPRPRPVSTAGHKTSAKTGLTVEEIVTTARAEGVEHTKRALMNRFQVGSDKANQARRILADEPPEREEETS